MFGKILTILEGFFSLLGQFSDYKKKKETEEKFYNEQKIKELEVSNTIKDAKLEVSNDVSYSYLLPKNKRDIYSRLFRIQSSLSELRGDEDSFNIKDFNFTEAECEQCDMGENLFKERLSSAKRPINKLVLHCSDSNYTHHDNVETIRRWHLERQFYDIGYHFVITKDGKLHLGRDIELTPAAQKNHNIGSVTVLLTGKDIFSNKQLLVAYYCVQIALAAGLRVNGHTEINPYKTCPNFDVKELYL